MFNKFWNFIRTHVWAIVLGVLIVAFGAYTVKVFIDDHNRNKEKNLADNTDNSREDIVDQFFTPPQNTPNPSDQPQAPTGPVSGIRGPVANVPEQPTVLGSETQQPVEPAFKPYRNDQLKFETLIPNNAIVNATDTQATATPVGHSGIYWSMDVYRNTTDDLNTIEKQLRSSPSTTGVSHTTLGGLPALVFSSPNLRGGTGYAVINNSRLYYLVGNFAQPELLAGFKFF